MKAFRISRESERQGFTLVELLLSMTVLSIIMMVSAEVIGQMQKSWSRGAARVEQFREARTAFETITRSLRQATLRPYMTYQYNSGATPNVPAAATEAPIKYIRFSELQFVTGQAESLLSGGNSGVVSTQAVFFQAALGLSSKEDYQGLNRLLCGRGYFLMFGDDEAYRPGHVSTSRSRFRLMEYRPPAEANEIYTVEPGKWFQEALNKVIHKSETAEQPSYTRPVAENIVALIFSPRVAPNDLPPSESLPTYIAPEYDYDSTLPESASIQGMQYMLPPIVQVTLVAIDEASAALLAEKYGTDAPDLVRDGAFTKVSKYQEDLDELEAKLREEKLNYRVFSKSVGLRNSKWDK